MTRWASSPSVLPLTHAGARLHGSVSSTSPRDATRTTILSWGSPSFRVFPARPAAHLSMPATLLGFVPLQRIRGAESTLLLPTGPTRLTTFRPQAFAASRRLTPPPTSRVSRRGDARGVLPSGVSPLVQVRELVARDIPSWRSSLGLRSLPLGRKRTGGAMTGFPGRYRRRLLSPTGSSTRRESVPCEPAFTRARRSIPSWSSPPEGLPAPEPREFHPRRSRASLELASTFALRRPPLRTRAAPQRPWLPEQCRSLSRPAPFPRFPAFVLLARSG